MKVDNKELLTGLAKSLFGAVPCAGSLLDEVFFEYSGRIKQKRLNVFIEILFDGFTEETDLNLENIKTEDFMDLFEAVLRRVVRTKSEAKLLRFKKVLIKGMESPVKQIGFAGIYLDLITDLTEEELSILYYHSNMTLEDALSTESEKKKSEESFAQFRTADFYGLDDKIFDLYKQRLYSKGLLSDLLTWDAVPLKKMYITEFGLEFLDFIQSE